jgi:hypothetical protein
MVEEILNLNSVVCHVSVASFAVQAFSMNSPSITEYFVCYSFSERFPADITYFWCMILAFDICDKLRLAIANIFAAIFFALDIRLEKEGNIVRVLFLILGDATCFWLDCSHFFVKS